MLYLYRIPLFQNVFECSFLSIFLPACLPCCSPTPPPSKEVCDSVVSQLVVIRLRKAIQLPRSAKGTATNHSQLNLSLLWFPKPGILGQRLCMYASAQRHSTWGLWLKLFVCGFSFLSNLKKCFLLCWWRRKQWLEHVEKFEVIVTCKNETMQGVPGWHSG